MKNKKKLLALLMALLVSATGCAKQNTNIVPANAEFCLGSCMGNINSNHVCVWQYLMWQFIHQG